MSSIAQKSENVKGKVFYDERIKLNDLTQKQRDEIERGKMERVRVTELKQKARKKAETLNKMLTKPTIILGV